MNNQALKGRIILVVEDDPSSRLYLNKILEKAGAVILNAGDGMEAIKVTAENTGVEIILMDIQLPVMDGYTAAKKIREMGRKIRIIAQTAYGISGDLEEIMTMGFDDYILKPIYADQLIEKLVSI